jgi:AraC-like DNA-binding protein
MSFFTYIKGLVTDYILIKPDQKNLFDHHFFDHKYYAHQASSIENFAHLLNISTEEVDQISTNYHGVNFINLINETRCKLLVRELENPVNSNLPIESVIGLCGFEDVKSFSNFFKSKNFSINGVPQHQAQIETKLNSKAEAKK